MEATRANRPRTAWWRCHHGFMQPGYGSPLIALTAMGLMAIIDLRRSREAALRGLSVERRARYGRLVMSSTRMVVPWAMVAIAFVCATLYGFVGSPAWWLWLLVAVAGLGSVAVRARARVRFQSFMGTRHDRPPLAS